MAIKIMWKPKTSPDQQTLIKPGRGLVTTLIVQCLAMAWTSTAFAGNGTELRPILTPIDSRSKPIQQIAPPHSITPMTSPGKLSPLKIQLLKGLTPGNEIKPGMARLGVKMKQLAAAVQRSPKNKKRQHYLATEIIKELARLSYTANKLQHGLLKAEKNVPSAGGSQAAKAFNEHLNKLRRNLEAQDKMAQFEIQQLMSQYNQAEKLASQVQKKKDDTSNAIIGKIG